MYLLLLILSPNLNFRRVSNERNHLFTSILRETFVFSLKRNSLTVNFVIVAVVVAFVFVLKISCSPSILVSSVC